MRRIAIAAAAAAFVLAAAGVASAADHAELMKTINAFNDGLNANKLAVADLAPSQVVIDEFAPHHWSGPNALKSWWADFGTYAKANGVTDPFVKIGQPTRVEQSASHAYVIVPSTFTFKQKGKAETEQGSMTIVMDHMKSGWKIAGFAWTGPRPTP